MHPPSQEKSDDSKDSFFKNQSRFSIILLRTVQQLY